MSKNGSGPAALISAIASVAQVFIVVIGGIFGYFLIEQSQTELAAIQRELAAIQKDRELTPIVKIDAYHTIDDDYSSALEFLGLHATIANVGLVPVAIKTVRVVAFDGEPEQEIAGILVQGRVDKPSDDMVREPPAPDEGISDEEHAANSSGLESGQGEIAAPVSITKESNKGKLYPVSGTRVTWSRREDLDEKLPKEVLLQPGQRRSVRFGFVFEQPEVPRWYRFVLTVDTADVAGEAASEPKEVVHMVRLGPFPVSDRYRRYDPEGASPADDEPMMMDDA